MSDGEPQILLILVGLPGSGKTTFADALVKHSFSNLTPDSGRDAGLTNEMPKARVWIRASQDEAPNRRRQECEAVVRQGLRSGNHVVVDRVGFDAVQRSHFIQIAQRQPRPPRIYCLIFETSHETLTNRLNRRITHPTLPDPETAMRVLGQMERGYSPPRNGREGIDKILVLREGDQGDGVWNDQSLDDILRRIEVEGVEDPCRDGQVGNNSRFISAGKEYGNRYRSQDGASYAGQRFGKAGGESERGHGYQYGRGYAGEVSHQSYRGYGRGGTVQFGGNRGGPYQVGHMPFGAPQGSSHESQSWRNNHQNPSPILDPNFQASYRLAAPPTAQSYPSSTREAQTSQPGRLPN